MVGYCRQTDRLGVGFELKNNRNGLWRGQAPRRRAAIEIIWPTTSLPTASLTIERRGIFGIREITRSFRRFSVKCPRYPDVVRFLRGVYWRLRHGSIGI